MASVRLISRPRLEGGPLWAIGLLLTSTLVLAGWSAHEKRQAAAAVARQPIPTLQQRLILVHDRADGSIVVKDAQTDEPLPSIVGEAGFARSVLRSLAQSRLRQGGGPQAPFLLSRGEDGSLHISDPQTGRDIDLTALGPTNAGVFAVYLGGLQ
ncbi:MAG: photosynthetic complex assembly protein PuhC [Betaproteobacteria bacterium]|nr:photosynthetic complex assembly protein PuhC [Betaproteobacteria bacterium]NCA16205.1 photosynthetic complex assembly protein PuhC [Betaproteobacteria bacterium]